MRLRKLVAPLLTVAVLGGGGYAAYATRAAWWPHGFPAASAAKSEGASPAADDEPPRVDRVTLSAQAQKNLQLEVDTLAPREYWRTILIPGVVADRPGESDRGVPSRVAGIITDIKARP